MFSLPAKLDFVLQRLGKRETKYKREFINYFSVLQIHLACIYCVVRNNTVGTFQLCWLRTPKLHSQL